MKILWESAPDRVGDVLRLTVDGKVVLLSVWGPTPNWKGEGLVWQREKTKGWSGLSAAHLNQIGQALTRYPGRV